jgi:hypothetical protein
MVKVASTFPRKRRADLKVPSCATRCESTDAFEVQGRYAALHVSREWPAKACNRVSGARESNDLEGHLADLVSDDVKGLFASLRMRWQRPVAETELTWIINGRDNSAGSQNRDWSERQDYDEIAPNCDVDSLRDDGGTRMTVALPLAEGIAGAFKDDVADTKSRRVSVVPVPVWKRVRPGGTDLRIGHVIALESSEELTQSGFAWPGGGDQHWAATLPTKWDHECRDRG